MILVSGGTRQLPDLWKARRRGVRIVQRLAQGNWIHRARFTDVGHYYRSVRNNLLLAYIRRFLAHRVVYQSEFVQRFWQERFGEVSGQGFVIHNGVDLELYSPNGEEFPPADHIRMLVVEGHLGGGNEPYLENAVHFAEHLQRSASQKVELMVVGDVPEQLRHIWDQKSEVWINWTGVVERQKIAGIDRSAHFLFSAELNAGCPNSVVEAMACGLPVIGFETGSLPELVNAGAGIIVPYGGDYWKLETPDLGGLTQAGITVLQNQSQYRQAARKRAEAGLDVQKVVADYLAVLLND